MFSIKKAISPRYIIDIDGNIVFSQNHGDQQPSTLRDLHIILRNPTKSELNEIEKAQARFPSIQNILSEKNPNSSEWKHNRDILLRYGKPFPNINDFKNNWPGRNTGQCFSMSFLVAQKNPNFLYTEGIGIPITGKPMLHAWNICKEDGKVYDFTWPGSHLCRYYGIIFEIEWIRNNCLTKGAVLHHLSWKHNEKAVLRYLDECL